jgi:hypothetical protein
MIQRFTAILPTGLDTARGVFGRCSYARSESIERLSAIRAIGGEFVCQVRQKALFKFWLISESDELGKACFAPAAL